MYEFDVANQAQKAMYEYNGPQFGANSSVQNLNILAERLQHTVTGQYCVAMAQELKQLHQTIDELQQRCVFIAEAPGPAIDTSRDNPMPQPDCPLADLLRNLLGEVLGVSRNVRSLVNRIKL